jgi:arylsulfatase A-like enzyme
MQTPNIIVIMADQLKASALRLYGNQACPTPNLQRLAREGVVFEHAITPHPHCVPARVAFWTGRYPHQTGCRRNQTFMPVGAENGMRAFRERGYHVGLIGKNHCFQDSDHPSLFDTWLELGHGGVPETARQRGTWVHDTMPLERMHQQGRDVLHGPDRHLKSFVPDCIPEAHTTGLIGTQTRAFIEEHARDPFALWVSFPAPHEPYIVPKRYFEQIDPAAIQLPPFEPGELESVPERTRFLYRMLNAEDRREDLQRTVRAYLANARFIDEMVGEILAALDTTGRRKETIVVFCSDHGDFAGEHNMMIKGGCFYDCLTRVPLVISWPEHVPAGVRDFGMANLVDVLPTVFTLIDGEVPGWATGQPLSGCTNTPPRSATFSEYGAGMPLVPKEVQEAVLAGKQGVDALMATLQWREAEGRRKMVRTPKWKYTYDPMDPVAELYDLERDPFERENLAASPEYAPVTAELRGRLLDWSLATEDAKPVPLPEARVQQ